MSGVIVGGWGFVIAAYVLSALVLLGYALSVHLRYRAERGQQRRASEKGEHA